MAKFQRLAWADLDNLTRAELLDRVEVEQAYWARKEQRGLSAADRDARKQFSDILFAALDPSGLADSMAEDAAWLRGERSTASSFWDENPGRPADVAAAIACAGAAVAASEGERAQRERASDDERVITDGRAGEAVAVDEVG